MRHIIRMASIAAALGLALTMLIPGSLPAARAAGVKVLVHDPYDTNPCPGENASTLDTINQAVAAVMAGGGSGTITVCPGTYDEEIGLVNVTSLKLIGKPGAKIVPETVSYVGSMIRVENSTNVTVQGFILDATGSFSGVGEIVGIDFVNSSGTITKNYLFGIRRDTPASTSEIGIRVTNAPAPVKVFRNTVYDYGYFGIYVVNSPRASVSKNLLWSTSAYGTGRAGIHFETSDGGSITSNTISSDWIADMGTSPLIRGIRLVESSKVKVSGNKIGSVTTGLDVVANHIVQDADYLTISANRFVDVYIGILVEVTSVDGYPDPSSDNDKITSNTFYAPTFEGNCAIWLIADPDGAPTPSLTNTTISGNKQYGFTLYDGRLVRDMTNGGVINYSTSNKTIPPPTGF